MPVSNYYATIDRAGSSYRAFSGYVARCTLMSPSLPETVNSDGCLKRRHVPPFHIFETDVL